MTKRHTYSFHMYVSSSSHHHVQIVYGGLFSPVCSHLSVCKKQQPHLQTIHHHHHGHDHDDGDDDDDKDRKNENKMKYLNIQRLFSLNITHKARPLDNSETSFKQKLDN